MKYLSSALLLPLLTGIAHPETGLPGDAYMEAGLVVTGLRAPYYDEAGQLQAQLLGARARTLENGRAEVEHLRVDVYDNGAVTMKIYAPQCRTTVSEQGRRKVFRAESDGEVLIELERMTIAGRGFVYDSAGSRFEVFNDVRVLVERGAWDRGIPLF